MAKDRSQRDEYTTPLRRLLLGIVVLCLLGIFLVWRIDSPRVERFRAQVLDTVVPSMEWAMVPVTARWASTLRAIFQNPNVAGRPP